MKSFITLLRMTALVSLSFLALSASSLSLCAQKSVKLQVDGKILRLAVSANGDITATGIKGNVIADGKVHFYAVTKNEVEIQGEINKFDCAKNQLKSIDLSACSSLTDLNCSQCGLKSLEISKNRKLQSLDCSNNILTELNTSRNRQLKSLNTSLTGIVVYDFSNNSELVELNCSDVSDPTSGAGISELNVKGLAKLKKVNASGSGLKYFELENNPELAYLNVRNNLIANLSSIRDCPKLEELYCDGNRDTQASLKDLDLTHNPELRILHCYNTGLSSLNLSKCPKLEELLSYTTDIITLDVTNNPKLKILATSLQGAKTIDVSKNLDLEEFSCEWSMLSSLDLRNNTKIKRVYVGKTNLTKLNLSHNGELEELRCYKVPGLTKIDLSNNPKLKSIDCNECSLETLDFSKCKDIASIKCYSNNIKGANMTAMMNSLPRRAFGDKAKIEVIDSDEVKEGGTEQNVCLKSDVAIATAKNWMVIDYNRFANQGKGQRYKGSDADATSTESVVLEFNKKAGEQINFSVFRGGKLSIEGTKEPIDDGAYSSNYTLTSNKVLIKGDVEGLIFDNHTGLKSIDLSNCTSMRFLECQDNEVEGTLDLSRCINLEQLYCENNKISEIKFPENSFLTYLYAHHNAIKGDLKVNSGALTRCFLNDNQLTSLDLSAATELESLECNNNRLSSLVVKSRNLKYMLCQNNQLRNPVTEVIVNNLPTSDEVRYAVMLDGEKDMNQISSQSIKAALLKNWIVLDQNGNENPNAGIDFEGKDYTAVTEVSKSAIVVYPNPAIDFVYVKGAESRQTVLVYTLDGVLAKRNVTDENGEAKIDLSDLREGTYIFIVDRQTVKVIKK